jgi:hypothetical protein
VIGRKEHGWNISLCGMKEDVEIESGVGIVLPFGDKKFGTICILEHWR